MKRAESARGGFAGLAAVAVAAAIVPLMVVMACGPDWEPEVFVPEHHPENAVRFADGHLGVLQRGYYHAELVVAYRYLHGGKLSDAEKAAFNPPPPLPYDAKNWQAQHEAEEAAKPNNRWIAARAQFAVDGAEKIGEVPEEKTIQRKTGNYVFNDSELNCTDGAFENAIATLNARAKKWGPQSAEIKEWIRGQDAVFSNCAQPAARPDSAKPEWPALLRQDRAYQIAAADFYAANFDDAVKEFEAIGRDTVSPWSRWGEYLAARAEVRKAGLGVNPNRETAAFDLDLLKAAQTRLLRVEQQAKDPAIRHAAEDELGFVEVRLDPGKRLDDVSVALAGPAPDPDFKNHVTDLDFLLDHPGNDGKLKSNADLVRWIQAMQSGSAKGSTDLARLPWLVASLAAAQPQDAQLPEMLSAAAKVPVDSPAYATVSFHRARLLTAAGKTAEARALTTTLLASLAKDDNGTRNAFLQERMPTAATLNEFLADAPRAMIGEASSQAASMTVHCTDAVPQVCKTPPIPPLQFDADAASYLNLQMPLATLMQAAESPALPAHLRQAVAIEAWVRALGLSDAGAVRRMAKLLPAPMRQTAGGSDGFPATLAMLRAPGARPFLQQGVQRSMSYAELDHYRDNWWCGVWTDGSPRPGTQSYGVARVAEPPLELLTGTQRQQAAEQAKRLEGLPQGLVWTAQRAIEYVKAHPQDKEAPEALALIVRGTRYGCAEYNDPTPQKAVSKQAFEMLHRMYPKSEWAAKTKYYY